MLDIETLERLSYERSKMWGECLKKLGTSAIEGDHEIAIAVPNKELDEEDFVDDIAIVSSDHSSMEDLNMFEDEAILKDITNRTSLGQKVSPLRHVRNHSESAVCSMYNEADSAELQDVLNETRPLLEEHKRKWKEAGLDQVLNTFDPEKIEEKVGGWMRRNHSMGSFSERPSKPLYVRSHLDGPPHASAMKPRTCPVPDSDSESLHSVDTARYIRSSRNRLESRRRRNSSRSSMTIKTFRFVQSKRDALREKYACLDSDETPPSGANYYRSRTQSASRPMHVQSHHSAAKRVNVKRSVAHVQRSCRRKRLHKYRHSSSYATSTSLSSSEDDCRGRARYPRPLSRRQWLADTPTCRLLGGCRCLMAKGNIWSKASGEGRALGTRRTTEDKRPCMRESECGCYCKSKLCKETRHIADTSTEDWVVENCKTPPKKQLQPGYQRKLAQSVPAKAHSPYEAAKWSSQYIKPAIENTRNRQQCADLEQPKGKSRKKVAAAKPKEKAKTEVANLDKEKPTKKVTRSKAHSVTKSREDSKSTEKAISSGMSSPDSIFMRELEFAIENSKRTFEIERKNAAAANAMNTESAKQPSTSGLHEDAVLVPEKEGHLMSRESSVDSVSSLGASTSTASSLRSLRPQPRSVKLRKMHKMLTTDNTFFTFSHNVCNSTAVKGDTATTRQIIVERRALPPIREVSGTLSSETGTKPKRPNKRAPVVSSTKQTSSHTASSSAAASPITDNDCIVVSSSTDLPVPKPARAAVAQRAPHTDKGILLYAPNRQNLTPAQSLKDGFFHVTLEHLSAVIGKQEARKFMKYDFGRRHFARSSSVYYRPPASPSGETDSDDDDLERVGKYGELYESFDKGGSERH